MSSLSQSPQYYPNLTHASGEGPPSLFTRGKEASGRLRGSSVCLPSASFSQSPSSGASTGGPSGGLSTGFSGAPSASEGHLGHLLYSIALARNDRSRVSALLTLEANCVSLLSDTQRLHAAFTALDAIVCNAVPFTLKTGGSRRKTSQGGGVSAKPAKNAANAGPPKKGDSTGAPAAGSSSYELQGGPPSGPVGQPAAGNGISSSQGREVAATAAAEAQVAGATAAPEAAGLAAAATPAARPDLLELPQRWQPQQKRRGEELAIPGPESPEAASPGHPLTCSSDSVASASPPEPASPPPDIPSSSNSSSSMNNTKSLTASRPPCPPRVSSSESYVVVRRPFSVLSRLLSLQVWVSIAVTLDCFLVAPKWLQRLVGLLHALARSGGTTADQPIRATACSCLEELELSHPGLLFPLLGPEGLEGPLSASAAGTFELCRSLCLWGPQGPPKGPLFLVDLLQREAQLGGEACAVLLLRCMRHLCENVICEGQITTEETQEERTEGTSRVEGEGPSEGPCAHLDISPEGTADLSSRGVSGDRQMLKFSLEPDTNGTHTERPPEGPLGQTPTKGGEIPQMALHYRIPSIGVSAVPLPAITLSSSRGSTSSRPPRLVRSLTLFLKKALALVLEGLWGYGDWAQASVCMQLAFFSRLLCLPAFSSVNVLLPFLFSSRLHLIHAWALLVEALGPPSAGCGQCPQRARCPFTKAVGPHAALLEERLRGLLQDQTLSPHDRVLCIRWYMALMQHPDFSAAFSSASPSVFCPSAADPPSVKEHLLQALLLRCSSRSSTRKGSPANLYDVCGVMYEFRCVRKAPEIHAVVFRFLLRSVLMPHLYSPQLQVFLCEHLRCHPVELGPSVLLLLHHASRAAAATAAAACKGPRLSGRCLWTITLSSVCESLLLPLVYFLETVEPAEDLVCFSPLIFELSVYPMIPPQRLLPLLRRLSLTATAADKGDSSRSWHAALCVLAVTKQLLLTHRGSTEVRDGVGEFLQTISLGPGELDTRQEAELLLRALNNASANALMALLTPQGGEPEPLVERYLSHVSPPQFRFNGSVPFLSLCKSTRERRLLCGLLDEQSAFFLTPKSPPGGLQGGLAGAHEAPTSPLQGELQDLHKQKACFEAVYNQMHGGPAIEALTYGRITPSDKEALPTGVCWGGPRELLQGPSAVAAYYNFLASHSFSVCLPFRLRAIGTPFAGLHKALDGTGASAGAEPGGAPLRSIGGCQGSFSLNALYSIELFFSHSPHYRPLHSVCIPFLQSPIAGPEGGTAVGAQAEAWSPLTKSEEKILQEASEDAFPFNYEIILKLEPLEPVPTVISVGVRFSDERGATYSGSLPPFSVSFQDLFLPVCAPPEFRAVLFDAIWKKTDTAKSVKTLDLKSTVVKQMIEMSLRPFLIEEDFSVETEAFDFCRDQYLHEYPEPLGEAGEASSAAFALGAAPLDGATVVEAPSSPSVPGIVSGQGALQGVDWQAAEVPDMADNADTAAFDVFVDDYFNGQVPYSDIFKDSTDTERSVQGGLDASSTEASGIPVQSPATGPQLDTMRALIFLPPRYHLLFKFTVSPKTTLVRCATDRWEALGYLDAFFSSCYALALSAGHSVGP